MRFQPPKFDGKVRFSNAFSGRWQYKITFHQESGIENAEYQYIRCKRTSGLDDQLFITGGSKYHEKEVKQYTEGIFQKLKLKSLLFSVI